MKIQSEAASQYEKLPTFRQYCKAQGKDCNGNAKVVTVVWFPSQYPSLSIHTEVFRLRVSQMSPDYAAIEEGLRAGIDNDEVFIVHIVTGKQIGRAHV